MAKVKEPTICQGTLLSRVQPGHVHTCKAEHDGRKKDDHFCRDCGEWWFTAPPGNCCVCGGSHGEGACLL